MRYFARWQVGAVVSVTFSSQVPVVKQLIGQCAALGGSGDSSSGSICSKTMSVTRSSSLLGVMWQPRSGPALAQP